MSGNHPPQPTHLFNSRGTLAQFWSVFSCASWTKHECFSPANISTTVHWHFLSIQVRTLISACTSHSQLIGKRPTHILDCFQTLVSPVKPRLAGRSPTCRLCAQRQLVRARLS